MCWKVDILIPKESIEHIPIQITTRNMSQVRILSCCLWFNIDVSCPYPNYSTDSTKYWKPWQWLPLPQTNGGECAPSNAGESSHPDSNKQWKQWRWVIPPHTHTQPHLQPIHPTHVRNGSECPLPSPMPPSLNVCYQTLKNKTNSHLEVLEWVKDHFCFYSGCCVLNLVDKPVVMSKLIGHSG